VSNEIKEQIKNALILQKEIFGDVLFENTQSLTQILEELASNSLTQPPPQPIKQEVAPNIISTPNVVNEKPMKAKKKDTQWSGSKSIEELYNYIHNCENCALSKTRNKLVFGTGNPEAKLMIIGEGPGADEDEQGLPFVGRAGKLLTDILKAINFSREEVFIANIVKCRPPGNRVPASEEMEECIPYLHKQIELIKPKFILCLGSTSGQAILETKGTLGSMRQKTFEKFGATVLVTYHPAALLRNPNWKKDTWEDVKMLRTLYNQTFPGENK